MKNLIRKIKNLKKNKKIRIAIKKRINEFKKNKKFKNKIFSELCFCLLAANFQAEKSFFIQKKIEKKIFTISEKQLAKKLKKEGHRFWPQRAKAIILAREKKEEIFHIIKNKKDKETRLWLAENIWGLGMKESSHFLRNIGFENLAIIDFHIIDLLEKEKIIERPKTITKKKYLEIEKVLEEIGKKTKLNLSELDLYLWYIETGKILK